MIHGRNLIVALDGVAVAAAKTCSLDMDQSFLEACSPVSGRTHTKIPTTYNWGVSVDGLVTNNSSPTVSLQDRLIAGTKCLLTFTDGSGNRRAGFVYVKSCKESGPIGNLATYSASFESTGPLYKYTRFTPTSFSESQNVALTIYNNTMIYEWQQGDGLVGVQITSYNGRNQLYVRNPDRDNWGLYKAPFSTIKSYLVNSSSADLNRRLVNLGAEDAIITIDLNTNYTFLANNDGDPIPSVFILYQ